ncbi:hypothetical protein [Streptomyces longispororuber]|uniref:hypothetical protein n=1 Tax=Streptomyces longispororuber TaxID=68230 RepID=UPI00167E6B46|nr:hypothetical protein [Streptomyces longispororuber]
MSVITCVYCGESLTGDLREVPLPPASAEFTGERMGTPLLRQGTYAVSPVTLALILHPDDAPGTVPHAALGRRGGCCGPDGLGGPNLLCRGCGAEVATEQTDCWMEHLISVDPGCAGIGPARS